MIGEKYTLPPSFFCHKADAKMGSGVLMHNA